MLCALVNTLLIQQWGYPVSYTHLRRLAIGQRILGLPVMAIYQNGEKVEELVKEDATRENIEAMIKKYL